MYIYIYIYIYEADGQTRWAHSAGRLPALRLSARVPTRRQGQDAVVIIMMNYYYYYYYYIYIIIIIISSSTRIIMHSYEATRPGFRVRGGCARCLVAIAATSNISI